MSLKCKMCPLGRRCERCRSYNAAAAAKSRRETRPRRIIKTATAGAWEDSWLLPDDSVTDHLAISIAARGERLVCLTAAERLAAAIAILQEGGTARDVCERLALPYIVTEDLCQRYRRYPRSTGSNSVICVALWSLPVTSTWLTRTAPYG